MRFSGLTMPRTRRPAALQSARLAILRRSSQRARERRSNSSFSWRCESGESGSGWRGEGRGSRVRAEGCCAMMLGCWGVREMRVCCSLIAAAHNSIHVPN